MEVTTTLFSEVAHEGDDKRLTVGLWTRRATMTVFVLLLALGLLNVFGQRTTQSRAGTAAAVVRVTAPPAVRGGLFFQSRIEILARRALDHPRIVLDDGWVEGMQVNSIEPSPTGESSRNGLLVLSYDRIDAGERLVVWLQFEVNPTNTGRRRYGLELDDSERVVARIDRRITVFP
jgi:hypothetical protein